MLNQTQLIQFSSEDRKINILCETDIPLGVFHDFLMKAKGWSVDRMIAAQKEEEEAAIFQKKSDCCKEE